MSEKGKVTGSGKGAHCVCFSAHAVALQVEILKSLETVAICWSMQPWGQSAALTWTSALLGNADSCGVQGSPSGSSGSEHPGEHVAEEKAHGGCAHVQDPGGLPEISEGEEMPRGKRH